MGCGVVVGVRVRDGGRGGVGDNLKNFIWGVMLLCVADFSSGEMQ